MTLRQELKERCCSVISYLDGVTTHWGAKDKLLGDVKLDKNVRICHLSLDLQIHKLQLCITHKEYIQCITLIYEFYLKLK